jgi:hypothetical protein
MPSNNTYQKIQLNGIVCGKFHMRLDCLLAAGFQILITFIYWCFLLAVSSFLHWCSILSIHASYITLSAATLLLTVALETVYSGSGINIHYLFIYSCILFICSFTSLFIFCSVVSRKYCFICSKFKTQLGVQFLILFSKCVQFKMSI